MKTGIKEVNMKMFENREICIYCTTLDEAINLGRILNGEGWKWPDGSKITDGSIEKVFTNYDSFALIKSSYGADKTLGYGNVHGITGANRKVMYYRDFIKSDDSEIKYYNEHKEKVNENITEINASSNELLDLEKMLLLLTNFKSAISAIHDNGFTLAESRDSYELKTLSGYGIKVPKK